MTYFNNAFNFFSIKLQIFTVFYRSFQNPKTGYHQRHSLHFSERDRPGVDVGLCTRELGETSERVSLSEISFQHFSCLLLICFKSYSKQFCVDQPTFEQNVFSLLTVLKWSLYTHVHKLSLELWFSLNTRKSVHRNDDETTVWKSL